MPLEEGWISAAHACTCNPRRLAHYPDDWSVNAPFSPSRLDADSMVQRYRVPENCGHTAAVLTTPLPHTSFSKPTHTRLNSGLVVLQPSLDTFAAMVSFLQTDPRVPTYSFPDQDLLADFFEGRWLPLSYRYNALKTLRYCHKPMWRDEDVKNVHFILKKPWYYQLPEDDPDAEVHQWCVVHSPALLSSLVPPCTLADTASCSAGGGTLSTSCRRRGATSQGGRSSRRPSTATCGGRTFSSRRRCIFSSSAHEGASPRRAEACSWARPSTLPQAEPSSERSSLCLLSSCFSAHACASGSCSTLPPLVLTARPRDVQES